VVLGSVVKGRIHKEGTGSNPRRGQKCAPVFRETILSNLWNDVIGFMMVVDASLGKKYLLYVFRRF